jgi:hypothetical protein
MPAEDCLQFDEFDDLDEEIQFCTAGDLSGACTVCGFKSSSTLIFLSCFYEKKK